MPTGYQLNTMPWLRGQQPDNNTFGNFAGGKDVFAYLQGLLKNGLPQNLQNDYRKNALGEIGGNLRSGTQALNEQLAGSGASIGAGIKGLSSLNQNANKASNDVESNLTNMNFNAKNGAIQQLLSGGQLNSTIGNQNRALNLEQQ